MKNIKDPEQFEKALKTENVEKLEDLPRQAKKSILC